MPIVVDNNFKRDTYGIRAERLNAIQGNFLSFQPVLNAQPTVVSWAADCYDNFTHKLTIAGVEMNESEGASLDVEMKSALMEEEYQNAKILAVTIYRENPVHLKDFGFDSAFPERRNDKISRVEKVLEENTRHIAAALPTLLPEAIITRLTDAKDAYIQALHVQDKERIDARHAVSELSIHFEKDTKILQDLRAWTYAMVGKQDPRIGLIGMVNPSTGGNNGPVPAAPTNLSVDVSTMVFSWDAVSNAEGYKLFNSVAGVEWLEIYSGTDNFVHYVPESEGLKQYKIIATNNIGASPASGVMQYNYHAVLAAPGYISLTVINAQTGAIALNWEEVPLSTFYRLYRSQTALGATVAGEYNLVGEYTTASYSGTFPTGYRHWFQVVSGNSEKLSVASDAVYVDIPLVP